VTGIEPIGPTPGRDALDNLRFELKRGDPYEQSLSSRIEDALDAQTVAWEAWVRDHCTTPGKTPAGGG
jgi:hypothetical protein